MTGQMRWGVLGLASVLACSIGLAGNALAAGATDHATAAVSITVEPYYKIELNPHVCLWGQGHTAQGRPNYLAGSGEAALFDAGTQTDIWKPTGQVKQYVDGAVGRTRLWVSSNCELRLKVETGPDGLVPLINGAGREVRAAPYIGRRHGNLCNVEIWIEQEWEDVGPTPCCPEGMFLYVCAPRQGLDDPAGRYRGTVTITATPMD